MTELQATIAAKFILAALDNPAFLVVNEERGTITLPLANFLDMMQRLHDKSVCPTPSEN